MRALLLLLSLAVSSLTVRAMYNAPDSTGQERAVDYFYLHALSLAEQEKYDAAYDIFEYCHRLQPSSSTILFELANIYEYIGQKDRALAVLKEIVSLNPGNYQFHVSLVQLLEDMGRADEALQAYEEIARTFPDKSDVYVLLAANYSEQGEYKKAIEALDKYEAVEGSSELIYMHKYRIYTVMGDKDAAIGIAQKLVADSPDDASLVSLLAETYKIFGDKEQAIFIHRDALQKDSGNTYSLYALSGYYREVGNDSLYIDCCERILRSTRDCDNVRKETLANYMNFKEERGEESQILALLSEMLDNEAAFQVAKAGVNGYLRHRSLPEEKVRPLVEKILLYEPDNKNALVALLEYALERNAYAETIEHCDAILQYHAPLLVLYYYKGISYYKLGRKDEAIAAYLIGIEKCGEEAGAEEISDIYSLLGDTYYKAGRVDDAICAYDSALVYNSGNTAVLNNYAYYLALENRSLDKALEMSHRTLLAEPDEVIYIDTYAWILFLQGRYSEALEYAEKLLQAQVDHSAVEYHHCGDIYARNGNIEKALECWEKALEKGDDSKILKRKIKKKRYISNDKKK